MAGRLSKSLVATIGVLLAVLLLAGAQSTVQAQVVFHSPQSANLPTAETLSKGQWLFENLTGSSHLWRTVRMCCGASTDR